MTSHKAIVSGISGRYAVALFDLAIEEKVLDAVESDLSKLKAMMEDSAALRDLVSSPLFSREQQSKGIISVAQAAKLHVTTEKFLGVLAANRRLGALGATISSFEKLLAHHRGEVRAEVVSARKLTKKQLGDLEKKLKLAVGHDVAIDATVDETLLGGLTVQVGSRMVDDSLKTKLDNLAIAMKGVQ